MGSSNLVMGALVAVAVLAGVGCGRRMPSTPSHVPTALTSVPLTLASQISPGRGEGISIWIANYPDTTLETMLPMVEKALQDEGYRIRQSESGIMAEKEVGKDGKDFVRVSLLRGGLRTEDLGGTRVVKRTAGASGCAIQYAEFYGMSSPFKGMSTGPVKKLPPDEHPTKGLTD